MEGRCCECFWLAEDDNNFEYCNCPYEASFAHHPDAFMELVCNCFKPKNGCENCAHSAHHPETGELFCLGPAPVIFCEDVEQPCECWEEVTEEEKDGGE